MIRYMFQYLVEHRRQLTRFLVVGALTFGINFGMFHLFYGLAGLDYRISVSLAYAVTVVSHFLLHRFFTFEAAGQQLVRNLGRYLAMLALNYAVTLTMAWLVVEALGLSPYFSVIASTVATACTSFFVMKYFVFGKPGVA